MDGQLKEVRDVKRGEYFHKPGAQRVYVRGEYDRSTKRISAQAFDDINRELMLSPRALVVVGFTF